MPSAMHPSRTSREVRAARRSNVALLKNGIEVGRIGLLGLSGALDTRSKDSRGPASGTDRRATRLQISVDELTLEGIEAIDVEVLDNFDLELCCGTRRTPQDAGRYPNSLHHTLAPNNFARRQPGKPGGAGSKTTPLIAAKDDRIQRIEVH